MGRSIQTRSSRRKCLCTALCVDASDDASELELMIKPASRAGSPIPATASPGSPIPATASLLADDKHWTFVHAYARQAFHSRPRRSVRKNMDGVHAAVDWASQRRSYDSLLCDQSGASD